MSPLPPVPSERASRSTRAPVLFDPRRARALDGTEIRYGVTPGAVGAPWIVLAGGLGGGIAPWQRQIAYLGDHYRFLTYAYRDAAHAVADHAGDLSAVLAAERIERAGFVGWSVGVQVLLEAFPRIRAAARGLVFINGTSGRAFDALAPLAALRRPLLRGLTLLERARPTRRLGAPSAAAWMDRLGLVARGTDPVARAELVEAFGQTDVGELLASLRVFGDHDAGGRLSHIDVPVLVIAGERDPVVPRALVQQMTRRIPGAELLVLRGGAHCAPVEFPELVGLRIERFFGQHGR